MRVDLSMPLSLTAEFCGWDANANGCCVRICFGVAEIAVIATPQFEDSDPDDHDVSLIAAQWLVTEFGCKS